MKIEWDEPRVRGTQYDYAAPTLTPAPIPNYYYNPHQVPKRNADSMWTKVKNSISVLKQTHDGPPPRSPARGNSYGTSSHSRSRSTSSHPHSSSSGTHTQRSRSAGPSPSPRQARPYVTIATNGGPAQAIQSSGGQYGSAYVVQSPYPVMEGVTSPVIYGSPSPSPMYYSSSSPLGVRPKAVHRATAPHAAASPLRGASTPTSGAYTPSRSRPGVPSRSSTSPGHSGDPNGGVMYNGKLIVGDPNEVNRYISSQKGIEKWLSNVK